MTKAGRRVKSADKTFAILDCVFHQGGVTVTDVAEELGIAKSTAHSHLATMEAHEYLVQKDEQYRLSLRFLQLGGYQRTQMNLYNIGVPEIQALASKSGERANLATEERGHCVYLHSAKGEQAVELDIYTGMHISIYSTALGKTILAHYPEERVHEIIDEHGLVRKTENTITDREKLFAELEEIRDRGVAFNNEERMSGLRCVAAPIMDDVGDVAGAISVAGPSNRLKGERFRSEIPDMVRSTANVIELNMMHS